MRCEAIGQATEPRSSTTVGTPAITVSTAAVLAQVMATSQSISSCSSERVGFCTNGCGRMMTFS